MKVKYFEAFITGLLFCSAQMHLASSLWQCKMMRCEFFFHSTEKLEIVIALCQLSLTPILIDTRLLILRNNLIFARRKNYKLEWEMLWDVCQFTREYKAEEYIWTYEGRGNNEKGHNLYSSLDIIMMTKSRRMRWEEHEIRMKNIINEYKILVVELEWKNQLGEVGRGSKVNVKKM
jgi:hypothetical protein